MSLPSVFPRSIWYCGGDRGPGDRVGCTVESHRTHTHTHTHTHRATATKITRKGASNLSEHPCSQTAEFPMMPYALRQEGQAGCQDGVWRPCYFSVLYGFLALGGGQELRTGQIWKQSHTHTHSFTHKQHTPQQRGLPDLTTGREAEAHGSRVCGQGPLRGLVCPFIHH